MPNMEWIFFYSVPLCLVLKDSTFFLCETCPWVLRKKSQGCSRYSKEFIKPSSLIKVWLTSPANGSVWLWWLNLNAETGARICLAHFNTPNTSSPVTQGQDDARCASTCATTTLRHTVSPYFSVTLAIMGAVDYTKILYKDVEVLCPCAEIKFGHCVQFWNKMTLHFGGDMLRS